MNLESLNNDVWGYTGGRFCPLSCKDRSFMGWLGKGTVKTSFETGVGFVCERLKIVVSYQDGQESEEYVSEYTMIKHSSKKPKFPKFLSGYDTEQNYK